MVQTLRKLGLGVAAFGVTVACVSGLTVLAAPPGPIDGQNIPANFGAGNLVATQLNVTGYGNQTITFGGVTQGSELDLLYLAKTGTELKLAIAGNWNTSDNDNHVLILIGGTGNAALGQTEVQAEGVGGPPFRVQDLSRVYNLNTNGTPGNTADDTCDLASNGVTLPCAADYALGVDTFGGNCSVSLYTLYNAPVGTAECGTGVNYDVYASRQFVTQTTLANTNGIATNPQGVGFDSIGMDNSNINGVTETDGSNAASATTGLEMTIPFAAVGLTGSETITLNVILTGGGSGGFVSNQAFPNTGPGCATAGVRPDLSTRTCQSVNLASLATWTGGAEDSDGQINPAHYGGSVAATQTCPTDFGDQRPDPNAIVVSGGSEIDQLFVTNDNDNVYVGISGNLERNGNGLMLFFETGQPGGSGGTVPLAFSAGGRLAGMANNSGRGGSFLPLNLGPNGVIDLAMSGDDAPVDFDYAFEANGSGVNIWVDHKDLLTNTSTYYGKNLVNSNGSQTSEGVTGTIDFRFAYSFFNDAGVPGGEGDALTQAEVAAAAATAAYGFEFQIPLASIGLTSGDLPRDIEVWALVTGGDGVWISNQSLPSLRDPTGTSGPADSYSNLDQGRHDYSADGPCTIDIDLGNPQKSAYARTATVTLVPGGPACADADVNCDGSVNAGDLLSIRAPGTWQSTGTPGFVRADVNSDGAVNAGDLLSVRAPGTWQSSTGPCDCP